MFSGHTPVLRGTAVTWKCFVPKLSQKLSCSITRQFVIQRCSNATRGIVDRLSKLELDYDYLDKVLYQYCQIFFAPWQKAFSWISWAVRDKRGIRNHISFMLFIVWLCLLDVSQLVCAVGVRPVAHGQTDGVYTGSSNIISKQNCCQYSEYIQHHEIHDPSHNFVRE